MPTLLLDLARQRTLPSSLVGNRLFLCTPEPGGPRPLKTSHRKVHFFQRATSQGTLARGSFNRKHRPQEGIAAPLAINQYTCKGNPDTYHLIHVSATK